MAQEIEDKAKECVKQWHSQIEKIVKEAIISGKATPETHELVMSYLPDGQLVAYLQEKGSSPVIPEGPALLRPHLPPEKIPDIHRSVAYTQTLGPIVPAPFKENNDDFVSVAKRTFLVLIIVGLLMLLGYGLSKCGG